MVGFSEELGDTPEKLEKRIKGKLCIHCVTPQHLGMVEFCAPVQTADPPPRSGSVPHCWKEPHSGDSLLLESAMWIFCERETSVSVPCDRVEQLHYRAGRISHQAPVKSASHESTKGTYPFQNLFLFVFSDLNYLNGPLSK